MLIDQASAAEENMPRPTHVAMAVKRKAKSLLPIWKVLYKWKESTYETLLQPKVELSPFLLPLFVPHLPGLRFTNNCWQSVGSTLTTVQTQNLRRSARSCPQWHLKRK